MVTIIKEIDNLTLIITIIAAGLLGGLINYYMVHTKEEEFSNGYIFSKSISLGIGASALVPLFLKLISSTLLEPVEKGYPAINYFVVGGFCLVAAIYAKRFIEDIYGRITKAEKEAKEAKKTAEEAKKTSNELEQSATEPDEPIEDVTQEILQVDLPDKKTLNIQAIIKALLNSHYVYRTLIGISKETSLEKNILKEYLNEMQASGLVTSKINRNGNRVFKAVR